MRVLLYRDGLAVDCIVVPDAATVTAAAITLPDGGAISAPSGASWVAGPVGAGIGWRLDNVGMPISPPIAPSSAVAATKAMYAAAVQSLVDTTAKARGYNNGATCASYATSTNAAWKAEAEAFVAWRDAVWVSVISTETAVEAGTETAPTVAVLLAGLPVISWPD